MDKQSLPVPTYENCLKASVYVAPQDEGMMFISFPLIFLIQWSAVFALCFLQFFHLPLPLVLRTPFSFLVGFLSAMELLGKISAEFNVDIPFSLDALTVMGVKAQIEQLIKQKDSGSSNLASSSLSHSTLSSLSSTQRQLWYLSRNANNTAYNMIIACKTTNLNLEKFKKSIANLVANHPMLSAMVTCSDDGDPLLRIGDFSLGEIFSEENSPKEDSGIIQDITDFSEIPMNVEKGPLFLVKVVKCSSAPASVFFAIKIHHLICDGFSQDIIMNEIMKFYHLIQPSEVTKINEVLLPSFILSNAR